MTIRHNLEIVLGAAEKGATVITSNTRAARNLHREFTDRQSARNLKVWDTPEILPWSAWMKKLWREHIFHNPGRYSALLDENQQKAVWEQIITADRGGIFDANGVAEDCARAWDVLHAYGLPLDSGEFRKKADGTAFQKWAKRYLERCRKSGWVDEALLSEVVSATAIELFRDKHIVLWGFDSKTPQQERFLNALSMAGANCEFIQSDDEPSVPRCAQFDDRHAELRAAAVWAREHLERDPNCTIGVVVPDLEDLRGVVERTFFEILHPDQKLLNGSERTPAFEISLGVPISRVPIIAAALLILDLATRSIPFEAASRLIRSPFFGDEEELSERAAFDVALRKQGPTEISLSELADSAQKKGKCGAFESRLRRFAGAITKLPAKQSASRWSRVLLQLLGIAGWPGSRTADSTEHQARVALANLLAQFAKLDLVWPPMDFADMLRRLKSLADQTIFQPENLGTPIQIVGLLEAAGSQFDHLWILGLHGGVWPPEPSPSPLLPLSLQRSLNIPGSSSEERFRYAERVTSRLLRSSPDIFVSMPLREGDEELSPSPLFETYPRSAETPIRSEVPDCASVLFEGRSSERLEDETGPVVEQPISSGGTEIFKRQAACPFQAFAQLRLEGRELEFPTPGMDPRLRGGLLHKVLEVVWEEIRDQKRLREIPEVQREELVAAAVEKVMRQEGVTELTGWQQEVASLEKNRLVSLGLELLQLEAERGIPFAVEEREEKKQVTIGGITANVKVDRVDRLEDGSLILLDYKSGKPTLGSWTGERPDEPQIPIYATQLKEKLSGVAFVQLSRGEVCFKGYVDVRGALPKVKALEELSDSKKPAESWEALLSQWDKTLERLGKSFKRGHAAVDPKEQKTCERCHLDMLCRINESPLPPDEEGNDEQ